MFDYNAELAIKELFLFQYVLADAIDAHDMLDMLCNIYCVGENERNEIAGLLSDRRLNTIHTVNDFYRELRLKQYYEEFGGGYETDDERIDELIAIKGGIFETAQKSGLLCAYEKSSARAYDELSRLATEGTVMARRILGIMQMEGIYITRDVRVGLDNLRDVADWLDIQSLVTIIYYNEVDREEYLNKLFTVTQKSECAVIAEQLQIEYGLESYTLSETAKILEKAFVVGTAKRETCSAQQLRIIRSNTLTDHDKRTILLSNNKDLVPAVCGLPLRLDFERINIKGALRPVLNRTKEMSSVSCVLENNDLRNRDFFRGLCICSNSEYIRNTYADAISGAFVGDNVIQIDVLSLLPIDLDTTENNIFLRSCRENQNNIFVIKLYGKIDERIVNIVKSFMSNYGRKAFALPRFGISIDLSAVLPIFLCDKRNAQLLDDQVNCVYASEISENESPLLLDDLLLKKRAIFSTGEIKIDDSAKNILLNTGLEKISAILDQAILSHLTGGEDIVLSEEEIREYIKDKKSTTPYGFGGNHAKK